MPPKKKEVQKLSLGDFMKNDAFGGSWADEVEETYESGTQPLPPSDRPRMGGSSFGNDRGYSYRERDIGPARLPEKPPYLAHLGNLNYDVKNEDIQDLLADCGLITVRLIEDRETQRPKGFGYAEFETLDGLKKALAMDGTSFQSRSIKIRIADPPKDRDRGESTRDLGDWTRRGPLPDLPTRGSGGHRTGPSDFNNERRAPRDNLGEERARDITWERKGPLSPLPQPEPPMMSRDGSRRGNNDGRSESMRGNRRASPAAWGEGRQDGSRPPRRDISDRPERVPSAAERDMQWRNNMRPDAPAKSPAQSRSGSEAPPSPAPTAAVPATRPKLNLAKRTVPEVPDVTSPALTSAGDSKASPFGAARPINTAAREREVEEKRQIALKEKKEAEEKAKEERRLAKEAAAQETAAKAAEKADAEKQEDQAADEKPQEPSAEGEHAAAADGNENTTDQKAPIRPREPRENVQNAKSRANESGNWRQPSGDQRDSRGSRGPVPSGPRRGGGPPRGPRHEGPRPPRANGSNGPPVHQPQPPQPAGGEPEQTGPDEDGWEKVPNKGRRNQRSRPVAS